MCLLHLGSQKLMGFMDLGHSVFKKSSLFSHPRGDLGWVQQWVMQALAMTFRTWQGISQALCGQPTSDCKAFW